MRKIAFNEGWKFRRLDKEEEWREVSLPHDAMLEESRGNQNASGTHGAWFEGADYEYIKRFAVDAQLLENKLILEFEGVYRLAEIYVNGEKAAFRPYGFTNFYMNLSAHLREGDNEVRVVARNSDQPNCRWYTGAGIYRPVTLFVLPKKSLDINGIKIHTSDYKTREEEVLFSACETGKEGDKVEFTVCDGDKILYKDSALVGVKIRFRVAKAELWSVEHPKLYTLRVKYGEDERELSFGIREVAVCHKKEFADERKEEYAEGTKKGDLIRKPHYTEDEKKNSSFGYEEGAYSRKEEKVGEESENTYVEKEEEKCCEEGFLLNGKRIIIRGACIHSDNGVLGAAAYPFADERKIRLLKEVGYNAVRSAHNPCSKATLDACDRLGMLVLDEYTDGWYVHKTRFDYATYLEDWWKKDMADMVEKDYNHPSVVMYSTGNEVSETAEKKGIALTGAMTDYLHALDETRPVTCGINIFFNFLSSLGFGVYSEEKAAKGEHVGSAFFNNLAGIFGDKTMKIGATLHGCDVKTRDAFSKTDVAGYNYGILRYKKDLKKYPDRIILGSETFCNDAYKFYEFAKRNPRVIGDFVWAGLDYLGEVGIGSWEYESYAKTFRPLNGWISAGSGRIDLTGKQLAEALYTRVAFGLDTIRMAVVPADDYKKPHSPSAWKMSNAIESWAWNGCEGKKTKVEVYARARFVELFLNGKRVGKKRIRKDCKVFFTVAYAPGKLEATAYDEVGKEIGRQALTSGRGKTRLIAEPELPQAKKNQLVYIRMRYADEEGKTMPLVRGRIRVTVEGGTLLALGNACPYNPDGYLGRETDTYYGEALAVIRPHGDDFVRIAAESSFGKTETSVKIIDD